MTIQTRKLQYRHNEDVFEAHMAWDDALPGERPAVMVCHAFRGQEDFERQRATELAQAGYVGIALDVYGKGVVASTPEEAYALMMPLQEDRPLLQARLHAALAAVQSAPEVDAAQVAATGYCFGGMCALDLARTGSGLSGVVSFHGLLTPPGNTSTHAIDTSVLVLHGWDDPMVPPEQVLAFAQEMSAAGADWQLHAYGGTMHSFTNPAADAPESGTVYNADAQRRSWQSTLNFLAELFG